MKLPLHVLCDSRAHCTLCRNLEGGRPWREGLLSYYDSDGAGADFMCQRGKAWGEITPREFTPATGESNIEHRMLNSATSTTAPGNAEEICHVCASRSCPNVTVCCGGRIDVVIIAQCPLGSW